MTTLYFAYGSNMDRAGMRQRCPSARATGTARLDGWRFLVSVDGYASIVPQPGGCVHGVLWRLGPRDLAALDAYESVGTGLYRRQALPVRVGQRQRSAQVYVGRSDAPGRPRPGHLPLVIAAAQSWNLPESYCEELARWAGSGQRGQAAEPGEGDDGDQEQ